MPKKKKKKKESIQSRVARSKTAKPKTKDAAITGETMKLHPKRKKARKKADAAYSRHEKIDEKAHAKLEKAQDEYFKKTGPSARTAAKAEGEEWDLERKAKRLTKGRSKKKGKKTPPALNPWHW